jgi:hypothetical protein
MQLILVIPDLLDLPAAALASLDPHVPSLSRLIASSGPAENEQDGLAATACRACGIARQDDWPVAPWLARAANIDPGDAYWLCAEPATLVVGADDVRLETLVEDLSFEDAQALLALLNAHFAGDDLAFVAASPAHWLVRTPLAQRLSTRPPEAAIGSPLIALLPSGPDAPRWRRWHSELQMLFFEHSVNVKRQHAGKAPVNSVWFWGGGTASRRTPAASIFSRDERVRALARGSAIDVTSPPASFDHLSQVGGAAVWFDPIADDNARRDLATIDEAWLGPIERAMAARELAVELVVAGRQRALRFFPRRSSLVRRWRARLSPPRFSELVAGVAPELAI